jgi:hypothetical protein
MWAITRPGTRKWVPSVIASTGPWTWGEVSRIERKDEDFMEGLSCRRAVMFCSTVVAGSNISAPNLRGSSRVARTARRGALLRGETRVLGGNDVTDRNWSGGGAAVCRLRHSTERASG